MLDFNGEDSRMRVESICRAVPLGFAVNRDLGHAIVSDLHVYLHTEHESIYYFASTLMRLGLPYSVVLCLCPDHPRRWAIPRSCKLFERLIH
jgi:hypothetical protein